MSCPAGPVHILNEGFSLPLGMPLLASQAALTIAAAFFFVFSFATAINAMDHMLVELDGVQSWVLVLSQIALGTVPSDVWQSFQADDPVQIMVGVFCIIMVTFVLCLGSSFTGAAFLEVVHKSLSGRKGTQNGHTEAVRAAVSVEGLVKDADQISHDCLVSVQESACGTDGRVLRTTLHRPAGIRTVKPDIPPGRDGRSNPKKALSALL